MIIDQKEDSDPIWISPSTKLFVPVAPLLYLARSRLQVFLKPILSHKVTIISAPAGYGKSTFVKNHIQVIFEKLGVNSRAQAIRVAREMDL
jgi:ATP/maltotriose-dependent transcriptional regulator MalT